MTIKETNSTLKELNSIDPLNEYAYESALLAFLKLGGLPILTYDLPSDIVFFRTRTHENFVLFPKISSISIAPKKFVESFARCNRPFQNVFYCSEDRPTSYMELIDNWSVTHKPGDKIYVTIGEWEIKKKLEVIIITCPDKSKRTSVYDKEHGPALDTFINSEEGENKESLIIFYQYLFDLFRKPAKKDSLPYIITTAYCNASLMQSSSTNGIYYPSVPFEGNGINLAIRNSFFNYENLTIKSALMNELTVSLNNDKKLEFTETKRWLSQGIRIDNDKIIW